MSPTLSREETITAQQEGYDAYLLGKAPKECPYGMETTKSQELGDAWIRGYAASKTDRARANRESAAKKYSPKNP